MTTVEVGESLTYGFKLFAYLLVVAVLGVGGMALGVALAGPEVTDGATDNLTSPELLGGIVLGILGITVWFTGTFGLAYKLLADSVQRGVTTGAFAAEETTEQSAEPEERGPVQQIGPSPGEQTARKFGSEPTVPGAAEVPDRQPGDSPATVDSQPATAADDSESIGGAESRSTQETTPGQEPVDSQEPGPSQTSPGSDQPTASGEAAEEDEPPAQQAAGKPGKPERTAEEIAFGTTDESAEQPSTSEEGPREPPTGEQPAEEEPDPSPGEGSIPTYESMDESQSAEDSDESTVPSESDDTVAENSDEQMLPYESLDTEADDSGGPAGGDQQASPTGDPLASGRTDDSEFSETLSEDSLPQQHDTEAEEGGDGEADDRSFSGDTEENEDDPLS